MSERRRATVIHVGPNSAHRGGMASVIRALQASLGELYELHVVSSHRVGSPITRVAVFLRSLWEIRRLLRRTAPPHIVHVHSAARGSFYRKAIISSFAQRRGAIVVLHLHTGAGEMESFLDRQGAIRRAIFRRKLRHVALWLTASAATALAVAPSLGTAAAEVIDNPLPSQLPQLVASPPREVPELLYLGGFENPVKGGMLLLEALPKVMGKERRLTVTLAGPGEPPKSVAQPVRWVGWLDDDAKAEALQRADIVVVPSTSEGLPVALLEAMAYGNAVVATSVGSIASVLGDGSYGTIVPPADPDALGSAIAALVDDPIRRGELGKRARERAADFAPDRISRQIDGYYQRLLEAD